MIVTSVAFLASITSAFADRTVGNWLVSAKEHGCSAIALFEGGSDLFVTFDVAKRSSMIGLSDPKFRSLKDDEKYELRVVFSKGQKVDTGWGEVTFYGGVDDKDPQAKQRLLGKFNSEVLIDLASSTGIHFYRGDMLVDGFDLKGSTVMVAALRECAAIREKENPVDPFE